MKQEYEIKNIKDYLQPIHPLLIKSYLWVWIFMISFFGIIMAISDPFTPYLFYIMMPIIIVMDLWAFFIMSDVEKWQKLYILYIGIYSIALSIILYLSFFKIIYIILGVKSPYFLIFSASIYIILLTVMTTLFIKALKTGWKAKNKGFKGAGALIGISGFGVLGSRILIQTTTKDTFLLVGAFAFLLLAYLMLIPALNIHKFYLMTRYKEHVTTYELPKKTPKTKKVQKINKS